MLDISPIYTQKIISAHTTNMRMPLMSDFGRKNLSSLKTNKLMFSLIRTEQTKYISSAISAAINEHTLDNPPFIFSKFIPHLLHLLILKSKS